MTESQRKRERGRADRVLPGVWRLRLPLPWPGVPHCNAWAIRSGDGVVLFDTGIYDEHALEQFERALGQAGFTIEDIKLVVCTHAHSDHYGLASIIVQRAGCELWMHPRHAHMTRAAADPDRALERRIEVAAQSGVPLEPLRRWAEQRKDQNPGIAEVIQPDRDLVPGVEVETDLGTWTVHETPGHAPSHVCLFEADRRLLISGDHLLGRVSLYFDYGYTPDPVAEFLSSLNVIELLGARLCLPGHGRAFADVQAHIDANRAEIERRLDATAQALAAAGESTAYELVPKVFGAELDSAMMSWLLTLVLCFLAHLELTGRVRRIKPAEEGQPERWSVSAPTAVRP